MIQRSASGRPCRPVVPRPKRARFKRIGRRAALAAVVAALLAPAAQAEPDRAALMAQHRGGTIRLLARTAAGSIDPQVNYTAQFWQVFALAYDGLVAFRKAAGPAGREIVADLADAVPEPAEGGLAYRFRLRPGLRFSNGDPVRASDAAASFRRMFRVLSPTAGPFYGAILGADACLRDPPACRLEGVVADDDAGTVAIRLTRPDPEFLAKLALPHASVLPANAPPRDVGAAPLPGTGAYAIARYDPGAAMRLVRNPHFQQWSEAAQPDGYADEVRYDFGLSDEAQVTAVLNGDADWMFDAPPADRLGELGARHAGQVHLDPAHALWFLPMNTRIPPFHDISVRRAVVMALDRRAAVKLFGGPRLAEPLCQALPPGLPGHSPYCPHPYDPAAARRLVAESGMAGRRVTLVTDDSAVQRAIGAYVLSALQSIGLDARTRALSANLQYTYIQNTGNDVQISLTAWYADYPSASTILVPNFSCAAWRPNSDASTNIAGLCDPAVEAALRAAQAAPSEAAWAAADRAVTNAAAAAVLFTPRYVNLVSRRVGGFAYHDQYRWLIAQAWVR